MKQTTDLGRDKVWLLVLKLAVPSMIAQFVTVLYSIIDRMFIGNIPKIGDLALAGVGICGPIVTLLTSFGTLIGLGGSILMSMRLGAGRKKQAQSILAHSFAMLVVFSAVLTLLFLLTKKYLLLWFGASAATFVYADTYLTIYTAGTFFALMAIGLNYFITCQGFPGVGMTTVLIGAVTNIILDPVFIFGLHMDVAGAAIATVIAQFASCAFAFCFLIGKKVPIKITRLRKPAWSPMIVKRILVLGVSPFLILATDSVIIIVLNAMLQKYGGPGEGDVLITCATIVQSYMMLITGPMLGISSGTQAILSYNYGAKAVDRVKKAEKYILLLCLCFTTVMFILSRIVPVYFIRIYRRAVSGIPFHLGNPCVYAADHSAQLPVCVCGRFYCAGTFQNCPVSLHVPERGLHAFYYFPSHLFRGQKRVLRAAYCRRNRLGYGDCCLFPLFPQTSGEASAAVIL